MGSSTRSWPTSAAASSPATGAGMVTGGTATDPARADRVSDDPSIPEVIRRSSAYLERHGVDSPRANVETLLMHLLSTSRTGLYTHAGGLDTATAKALGRAL